MNEQVAHLDPIVTLYIAGFSVNQIADKTGVSASTVWRRVKASGKTRSASESVKLAIAQGRGAARLSGRKKEMSAEWKANMKAAADKAKRLKAKGVRVTPRGYIEFTFGPHAGRSVHVVTMEERLGRRLKPDEVVHHIDGDKSNNHDSNLALMTIVGHSRHHRHFDAATGRTRSHSETGKFKKENFI